MTYNSAVAIRRYYNGGLLEKRVIAEKPPQIPPWNILADWHNSLVIDVL